jgi:succinyl-CoA synthetase beta subunit
VPYTPITLHPPPPPPTTDYSEAARLAAEEDRRRRNTVASARFRVKVKERGKALEVSLQEKQEKVKALEKNIERLETENRWLKELLVEKARIKRDT